MTCLHGVRDEVTLTSLVRINWLEESGKPKELISDWCWFMFVFGFPCVSRKKEEKSKDIYTNEHDSIPSLADDQMGNTNADW